MSQERALPAVKETEHAMCPYNGAIEGLVTFWDIAVTVEPSARQRPFLRCTQPHWNARVSLYKFAQPHVSV